jgi:alpha-1,2-mannosyltransferase
MPLSLRDRLIRIGLLAIPFGLYGWAVVVAVGAGYNGKIGPVYNALGQDWLVFYTADRAWLDGHLSHIYDQVWLEGALNGAFGHWIKNPMSYWGFYYPPTWLLVLAPFAALPMLWGYALTQALSFGGLIAALRKTYGRSRQFIFTALSLSLCPAASNNVLSGQNGFLTCALFVVGFPLLEAQPILAGAFLGLASFKPQLCLMIPFALLGSRNWRAIGGAAASALALALLSLVVFGSAFWWQWLDLMLHPRHDVAYTGVEWGRLWDDSIYTCVRLLGASKSVADLSQAAVTLAAGACVYFSFRRDLPHELRFVVFLAASAVAAPHLSPYDMILPALGATILVWRSFDAPFRPILLAAPMAAWLAPIYTPPRITPIGFAAPVAMFALIIVALRWKHRADAVVEQPRPAVAIATLAPQQAD